MNSSLPEGSKIKLAHESGHEMISLPHGSGGFLRYLIALFLLFWMGGWFVGFTTAFSQIIEGKGSMFLFFWLGGWTLGGLFALFFLYRLLKKSVPESLLLSRPKLVYDTGLPPFQFNFHPSSQKEYWKSLFAKRKQYELSAEHMQTLKLRETSSGNRLTIDHGATRLEIGKDVSEIEREWLFEYLQSRYY